MFAFHSVKINIIKRFKFEIGRGDRKSLPRQPEYQNGIEHPDYYLSSIFQNYPVSPTSDGATIAKYIF